MRVVLLGPPGAGKGTQAVRLAEKLGVPHISTGELFRHNISTGTALGVRAKQYLDAGELVPTSLTNDLVDDRLNEADVAGGFILDGFPRTIEQAEALHDMLERRGLKLDAVVEFRVPEEVLVERLMSRGRADDTEDVIRNRFRVYRDETAPLLDYYEPARTEDGRCRRRPRRGVRAGAAAARPLTLAMVSLPGLRGRKTVPARTAGELDAMAAAGSVVAAALRAVQQAAAPGVSTKDLDEVAETRYPARPVERRPSWAITAFRRASARR